MTSAPTQSPGAKTVLLSWRRTALELGIVSIVAARYLGESANPWFGLLGVFGIAIAIALHAAANRVYNGGVDTSRGVALRHNALVGLVIAMGLAGLAVTLTL